MRDEELLELLRRSPELGMAALMEQYAGLVYAVARGRLPSGAFCAADVEDCAADAFSEFYLSLDRYAPEKGSVRAYLCTIARHNALDLARRRCREADALPLDEGLAGAETLIESGIEEQELRRATLEAVKVLEEADRELVLRIYYLGEPSREIRRRLGRSVDNVDARAHRAVEKLRKKLKEWG